MKQPRPSNDSGDSGLPERDPHLLAALQHAPDRDAVAPAELGQRIAQQARWALQAPLKTAPAAAPGMLAAWPWLNARSTMRLMSTWWTWLLQPARAGVVGTVLVAGFISLMWRDGVPPQALPGPLHNTPLDPQSKELARSVDLAASSTGSTVPVTAREASAALPAKAGTAARAHESLPAPPLPVERKTDVRAEAQLADAAPSVASPRSAQPATDSPSAAPALRAAPGLPATEVESTANRGLPREVPAPAVPSPQLMRDTDNSSLQDPLAAPLAQLSAGAGDHMQVQATRDQLLRVQRAAQGLWRVVPPQRPAVGQPVLDADGRLLGHLLLQGHDLRWQNAQGSWGARLPETAAPLLP